MGRGSESSGLDPRRSFCSQILKGSMRQSIFTLTLMLLLVSLCAPEVAASDWRWAEPKLKVKKVKPVCKYRICKKLAKIQTKANHKARVKYYHAKKLNEWKTWTRIPIPRCTWYGESGTGPAYAKHRYTMPQFDGSAYGKFQFERPTYISSGKYDDWSPLDQEIAARIEYWKHGIFPWTNCTGG